MSTILIRLGGPLQSWGSDSKYDDRRTDSMPTKSGVIGMIAAAMGRRRDESIEDLASLRYGVRVDNGGVIIDDFQITEMITERGKRLNSNLSHRKYLSDAVFVAGLEGSDEVLAAVKEALEHPAFPLFLGRRSCPATLPIVLGIREKDLYSALYEEDWQIPEWRRRSLVKRLRIVMDSEEPGPAVKRDVPVSFSPFLREYTYRYLKEMPPKIISDSETEHDAMSELR